MAGDPVLPVRRYRAYLPASVGARRFKAIERQALRKLGLLDAAPDLRTLSTLPGNRLERLKGDREGQYSIRINDQWRICFEWREGHAYEVEIADYH